jgi:hypothetical protein
MTTILNEIDAEIEWRAYSYNGIKFGEYVLKSVNKKSFDQTVAEMTRKMNGLPVQLNNEIKSLIDNANSLGRKKEFWNNDCGSILKFITLMAREDLQEKGINPTVDNLFDVFHIIVLNFAYGAHKDQRIKKFIKTSAGKGLFGRLFS